MAVRGQKALARAAFDEVFGAVPRLAERAGGGGDAVGRGAAEYLGDGAGADGAAAAVDAG
jgi:hypothetical protein